MTIITALAFATLLTDILIVLSIIYLGVRKVAKIKFGEEIFSWVKHNALILLLIASIVGLLGSLYFSEIAKLAPCSLCWFQRVFLYPQVVIFALALWQKKTMILKYTLPLSIIGALIAIYHVIITVSETASAFCGLETSCTINSFVEFGYITIPVMSLTLYLLLIIIEIIQKRHS